MTDETPTSRSGGPRLKTGPDDQRGAPPGAGTVTPAHGGRIGNPAFVATDAQRQEVRTLSKVLSQEMIADVLGISTATLQRHFREELTHGKIDAVKAVGGKLLQKALAGDKTCMIFYLRTQGKWNTRVELMGPGGGPIPVHNLTDYSDEQLDLLERAARLLAGGDDGEPDGPAGAGEGGEG